MNPGHRFQSGKRFIWNDKSYLVLIRLEQNRLNLSCFETGELSTVSEFKLLDALFREHTLHFPSTHGEHTEGRSFEAYPVAAQQTALWRLEMLRPLLERLPGSITDAQILERVVQWKLLEGTPTSESKPSGFAPRLTRPTVRRWLQRYQAADGDVRSLLPRYSQQGGKGTFRVDEQVAEQLEGLLKRFSTRKERWTIDDLYQELALSLEESRAIAPKGPALTLPSRSSVYRFARSRDCLPQQAKRRRQYQTGETLTYPLERVEMDHWRSDLIVVDDQDRLPLGRLTLTYMLCATTRYPLGYYLGFEPPGGFSLAECFVHAVFPKEDAVERYGTAHPWQAYGLPARLRVDRGLEFTGSHFQAALARLGVTLEYCPVRTPEFKGGIERSFRTLGEGLFHTLPGTTFSGVLERQEKNYLSKEEACIPLSSIDKLLHLYLLDVYAESEHRGLGGVPARAWERHHAAGFEPMLPESAASLSILLGETVQRRVWPYGLDWDGLRYQSEALAELRAQKAGVKLEVKRVRGDLSRVYVQDPVDHHWLEVPIIMVAQDYARGLSVWKHRVVLRYLQQTGDRVNPANLGRAKRKIHEAVDQAFEQGQTKGRSQQARWATGGKPTRSLSPFFPEGAPPSPEPEGLEPPPDELKLPERTLQGWSVVRSPLQNDPNPVRGGK